MIPVASRWCGVLLLMILVRSRCRRRRRTIPSFPPLGIVRIVVGTLLAPVPSTRLLRQALYRCILNLRWDVKSQCTARALANHICSMQ